MSEEIDPTGLNFTKTIHHDIYSAIDPTKTDLSQPGKVVLVTGAGRGIGRSIALRYAEAGVSTLILASRTTSQLDEVEQAIQAINAKITVHKYPLDVSSVKSVRDFYSHITSELNISRLDVLVNNAGTSESWVPLTDSDEDKWWSTMEVNLKGPFIMLKNFLPLMSKTAEQFKVDTDVVNVTSIGAVIVSAGASGYQISKLALLRLSEFVQAEYGDKGINCHGVHPGGVLTTLSKTGPDWLQPLLTDTPEIAGGFVVWLTKESRSWLSGRYMSVCWDVADLEAKKDDIVSKDLLKVKLHLA